MPPWLTTLFHVFGRLGHWLTHDPACRAAVITIVGGAIGILITLLFNRWLHRQTQMLSLRRSVYLRACDTAAEALQFLTTLPDDNVTIEQGIPLMRRVAGLASKLDMLAEKDSVAKLAAYQRAYFDEYASLIPAKRILEMRTATIALLKQQLLGLSQTNPTVQAHYEEHKKFFETEIARLERKSEDEYKELFKRSIDIPNRLSDKAAEVIIALRRELGLDIDEGWFRKTVATSVTIGQDRQKKLLAELEERLKNERIATERAVSSSTALAGTKAKAVTD